MAKSITLNEFDLEKIRRFTEQEIKKLAQNEMPFCYQVGSDVLVGRCKVLKVDDNCWRVFDQESFVFDFANRKNAIFYCIAAHKNQYQLAQEIKNNDSILGRLEFEAIIYRRRYKQANEQQDSWGAEYYSNKYTETMHKLDQVKQELKKNLNLAKYIKL